MPESKRPLKVFLCHASADKPAVRSLYKRLVADGVDAWLDAESLVAGQNWQVEIPKAIRDSDVVIVCLSEKSINKEGYVQREIKFALDVADEKPEGTIFVIPARLEDCKVPDRLSMYHWVELFEKDGYEKLLRALHVRAGKIGATLQIKKGWLPNISSSHPLESKKSVKKEEIPASIFENKKPKRKIDFKRLIGQLVGVFLVITALVTVIFYFVKFVNQIPESSASVAFTPVVQDTLSSLPAEIKDAQGVSMMLVPAGEFIMGNDKLFTNERPSHTVNLDAFYIDDYEITNALYKDCVAAGGGCEAPADPFLYNNAARASHPIVRVDWDMARSYCEWRGARLPTEAEWEKAARGENALTYPWNGDSINVNYANYDSTGTKAVGSYPFVRSPYGIHDMAGNVSEWVSDWYSLDYYQLVLNNNISNPAGPLDSPFSSSHNNYGRVFRGGSWKTTDGSLLSTTYRSRATPDSYSDDLGFRCAKDAP